MKLCGLWIFLVCFFNLETIDAQHAFDIRFQQMEHDFGTVRRGDELTKIFYFYNDSGKHLKLLGITPACSCTASEYPTESIPPGTTQQITVVFKADELGKFRTSMAVFFENFEHPFYLILKGKVKKEKRRNKHKS